MLFLIETPPDLCYLLASSKFSIVFVSVLVVEGSDCRQFMSGGFVMRCGPHTRFDLDLCLCNHEGIISNVTCRFAV